MRQYNNWIVLWLTGIQEQPIVQAVDGFFWVALCLKKWKNWVERSMRISLKLAYKLKVSFSRSFYLALRYALNGKLFSATEPSLEEMSKSSIRCLEIHVQTRLAFLKKSPWVSCCRCLCWKKTVRNQQPFALLQPTTIRYPYDGRPPSSALYFALYLRF